MSLNSEFVKGLFVLLNQSYSYAVLRGYNHLPDKISGHDIDILIKKSEFSEFKKELYGLVQQKKYHLLMVNENERFVTIVVSDLLDDKLEFIYLDFFFNYSLFGVNLVDAEEVLHRRIFNGKIYHVTLVDEFLEKFLNTALLDQHYPAKYEHILKEVEEKYSDQVNTHLRSIFRDERVSIDHCQKTSGKLLLFKAWVSSLSKSPGKQILLNLRFLYFYLKGWLKPNGFSLSITGPDGSGKTTILNELERRLQEIYREVALHHFRPNVIPRIAELAKRAGVKSKVDTNYSQPHRGGKTGILSSLLRLFYYVFDYEIGYYLTVKPVLFRRGIIIFDRYFADIISDSKRSRIYLDYRFVLFVCKLVPAMNYNFIIFVNPDIIHQRKQELNLEQLEGINTKLEYICSRDNRFTRIDNNETVDLAVYEILGQVLKQQHKKYKGFF